MANNFSSLSILFSNQQPRCHRDLAKTTLGQCQDAIGTPLRLDCDTAGTQLGPIRTRSRLDWDIVETRRTQLGHYRDIVGKFS
jgi:hypothetical protein